MRYLPLLLLLWACNNVPSDDNDDNNAGANPPAPAYLNYAVINMYPHDTTAFTQGLQYWDGFLYEGTGQEGASRLRKVDLESGKILREHKLPDDVFGEGITILNGKIYQLTWMNKTGFVYDLNDFKLLKRFNYQISGWGLTNDGKHLIVSDGSNYIYFWDPETFKEVKRISVQDQNGMRNNLNELEFIDGAIYANVWQTDEILKIDTATGYVTGKMDLSGILSKHAGITLNDPDKVLNGIAWDSRTRRMFVTGKYWPKIFELQLNQ